MRSQGKIRALLVTETGERLLIDELPEADNLTGAFVPISQGGTSKKAPSSLLGGGGGGTVAELVEGANIGIDATDPAAPIVSLTPNVSVEQLGINTTADETNPLAATINKALFSAKYVGDGGDGDLRYTMNKEGVGDLVSFLFQTNFSARAEFGLIGNDDFTLKVSPNGSTWYDGIVIDKDTGAVSFPNGALGVVAELVEGDGIEIDLADPMAPVVALAAALLTKLTFLTVTQAVDLDAIEARVNGLDQAVILKGAWDASAGTFPGSGSAQAGESWIVSTGGTVGGVAFNQNDRIIAIVDNASTSTFAANWFKADYTDQVLTVAGKTGAVTLQVADITDMSANGRSLTSAADYAAMRILLGLVIGTNVQAYDADLAALAALGSTGIAVRTAANTWAQRSVAVTASTGLAVSNGDGVSGNPTLSGVDATTSVKGVSEFATAAEFRAGTDTARSLVVDQVTASAVQVDLGNITGNVTLDFATFFNAKAAMTGNITFNAISNLKKGQSGHIELTHSGGVRTLSYNSTYFQTAGGSGLTLGNASGDRDIIAYYAQDNGKVLLAMVGKDVS